MTSWQFAWKPIHCSRPTWSNCLCIKFPRLRRAAKIFFLCMQCFSYFFSPPPSVFFFFVNMVFMHLSHLTQFLVCVAWLIKRGQGDYQSPPRPLEWLSGCLKTCDFIDDSFWLHFATGCRSHWPLVWGMRKYAPLTARWGLYASDLSHFKNASLRTRAFALTMLSEHRWEMWVTQLSSCGN